MGDPASASAALEVACAALGYLAAADATGMGAEEQAGCLQRLERVTSVHGGGAVSVLGAFTTGKGYSADADYSPRAWLIHKTGITAARRCRTRRGRRRAAAHPEVFAVLAAGMCRSRSRGRCASGRTSSRPGRGIRRTRS